MSRIVCACLMVYRLVLVYRPSAGLMVGGYVLILGSSSQDCIKFSI